MQRKVSPSMNNVDICPKCGVSLISEELADHECIIDVSNIMLDTDDPDHVLVCLSYKWVKISWETYEYLINRKFTSRKSTDDYTEPKKE